MSEHNGAKAPASTGARAYLRGTTLAFSLFISAGFIGFANEALAQSYQFNSITVEGNNRIEPSTIATYAGIARGAVVSAGDLNDAYQRILDSGLFETVEVVPAGNRLVIRVVEFPTVNEIRFEGNRRLKDDVLETAISSQPRRVLNPTQAERDAAAIAEAYVQSGRIAARVTPRVIRRSDNRADLVFEIFEGDVVEIERIGFVGNRNYPDRRLRRVLGTKQAGLLRRLFKSDTLVEDRIEFDKQVLRDFYQSRGYVDFRVTGVNAELARERDGYFLTFNIEEGQQFSFGEITTVSDLPEIDVEAYQSALKIRPGQTYSPSHVEDAIARLEIMTGADGHDFVRVEPRITRNDRDLTLDVEFALVRGPRVFVERIDIEGNTTTLDRVVRHQFKIAEGDPFNPRQIRQAAERIRALGFFSNSDVNAREGSTPDQVIIDVDVEEQPTGSLSFGGTYSSNSGFGLVAQFSERNFLGRGQALTVAASTTEEVRNYRLAFREPAFLGRDVSAGFDLRYQDTGFADNRFENTVAEFQPSLGFALGERSRAELRYTLTNVEMTVNTGEEIAGSIIDTEAARGGLMESSVGYSYTYDSRTTGLNPDAGWLFSFGQDFAGLGGDISYVRTTAKAVAQTKVLFDEVTLRATLEGGMLYTPDKDSRIHHRFALDSDILRGFEPYGVGPREFAAGTIDDALGGKYYAVARFEAEFPIGLPEEYGITGGAFYDVGSLWGTDSTATVGSIVSADAELRQVVGLSVFWDTPIGPLRFNFSKALQKQDTDREQTFNLTLRTEF